MACDGSSTHYSRAQEKAKKEAPPMGKPEVVQTHQGDTILLPEMVGGMVGMNNVKTFN